MALLAGWRAHRLAVPAGRRQATLTGLNLAEPDSVESHLPRHSCPLIIGAQIIAAKTICGVEPPSAEDEEGDDHVVD